MTFFKKSILDSHLYHVAPQEGVKLNQNECPYDVPLDLKVQVTEKLIKTDWNRYPLAEEHRLKNKLADYHDVDPSQICMSNGSNVLIQAMIGVLPAKSKVLVLDPTFVIYELQAELQGFKVIKVPLSEDFELLTEKTLATIKKEKPGIVFLANPNPPTGSLFDKRSLYRIIQMANCPVVIDEAYYEYTGETVLDWMNDFNNLIVMRTFSKAMGLAGVRFGYMISNTDIAEQIEKFLMTFRLSSITCIIAETILENMDYVKTNVQATKSERARLFSEMQKISGVRVYPSEANFLIFHVDDAVHVMSGLKEHGVLVRNVSNGGSLKSHLRVGVGTPEQNDLFLEGLKKIL